ncbi:Ypt/Rab-specific GTPase-activating protein GYP7 and related proteins [Ceraceosorus bombacis]|uniref:Ypt/Rab-specific GTPase-activating protein GYP7 and related proteins n=1 Tax=Ceraceosorus bombacis TaxID=401625 RepID=A0A0N7LAN2_9BASI|nr:Ypt/Rab-specific GTPase-activating protein GYP7 and related proteins [Ceraceosorus bombacis]
MSFPKASSSASTTDDDGSDYPDDIFGSSSSSRRSNTTAATKSSTSSHASTRPIKSGSNAADDDHLATWAKNTRFAVFSHFSQVTSAARNGAHALLSHPLATRLAADSQHGGPRTAGLANTITSLAQHGPVGPLGPSDPEWRHSEAVKAIGGEFDSARVFLARFARQPSVEKPRARRNASTPVSQAEWNALFDTDGTGAPNVPFSKVRELVFHKGLGPAPSGRPGQPASELRVGLRAHVWPLLLGADEWVIGEACEQRSAKRRAKASQYWTLKRAWAGPRSKPLEGLDPFVSSTGKDPLYASISEQELAAQEKACREYRETPWMKEQLHRIRVDCVRTDRKMPLFSDVKVKAAGAADGHDGEEIGGRDPAAPQKVASKSMGDDSTAQPNSHMQALADILLTYVIWDKSEAKSSGGANDHVLPENASPAEAAATIAKGLASHRQKSREGAQDTPLESYVQGMSDLCAPLYVVCKGDEAQTFWCFVGLMQRMRSNFYSDQSGMRRQLGLLQKLIQVMDPAVYAHLERTDSLHLFFCFRWLLVLFKREFDFGDILKLWEALWAAELDDASPSDKDTIDEQPASPSLSNDLHLFVVLAILQQHRDPLLTYLYNFDEILLYFQGLSQSIDVESTLRQAEVSARTLKALIDQKDRASIADRSGSATRIDAPANSALPDIDEDLRSLVI